MNLPAFALDVSSLFASDPERGRRVLDLMKRYDLALTPEWVEQMRAYAERVWHGLESAPEREPPICTPADKFAGCNFRRTDRLDSCHEPGGCLWAPERQG